MQATDQPTENPYVEAVTYGNQSTPLGAAWALLSGVLDEGKALTVEELADATGLHRRTIKGLLFHGRRAGKVRMVETPREVEVKPDLFMIRKVRGYTSPWR